MNKSIKRILILFVLLLVILSTLTSTALATDVETELIARASAIEAALDLSLDGESAKLSALADEYAASDTPLYGNDGDLLDKDAVIAELRQTAARLTSLVYDAEVLTAVDVIYENNYVKQYSAMKDVTDEMAEYLATYYDLSLLDTEDKVTSALVYCYMRTVGDVYGSFFNAEAYEDRVEDSAVEYSGIGVTVIQTEEGYAEVVDVTAGSGAESAGILIGDVITAVDGDDFVTLGYSEAINRVRGAEGTTVSLTVRRSGESLTFDIVRMKLINYSVIHKMLDAEEGTVGYIRISSFDSGTFTQFVNAVEELEAQGAKKFVFDVRNNLGGRLDAVLAILEYITPDDTGLPLVRLNYKNASFSLTCLRDYFQSSYDRYPQYHAAENHEIKAPIVVLCNNYTASAGELFTSCLRDFGMATVIGTRTFGKGMGQTSTMLGLKIELNLSTFYYDPPTSDNYEGIGLTPDVELDLPEEYKGLNLFKLTLEMDTQLKEALTRLEGVEVPTEDPDPVPPGDTVPPEDTPPYIWVLWVALGVCFAAVIVLTVLLLTLVRRARAEREAREDIGLFSSAAPDVYYPPRKDDTSEDGE